MENNNRRDFLKVGALLGGSMMAAPLLGFSEASANNTSDVSTTGLAANERVLGTGKHSLKVSTLGLGCMSMTSNSYNPPRDKGEMVKVIRGAVDLGVTFLIPLNFMAHLRMKSMWEKR